MANYRNNDNPDYILTNERLIPWLEKYVSKDNWIIELTGGEPGLYRGIDELVDWLSNNGYHAIIKTNGSLPIKRATNVLRVAAYHRYYEPPKYFDRILIVDKIDRDEKEDVCKKKGWDYKVIGYNNDPLPGESHGFTYCAYIDPHGHPLPCKRTAVLYTEWPDLHAMEYVGLRRTKCCPSCKAAIDCWKFIPQEWKTIAR